MMTLGNSAIPVLSKFFLTYILLTLLVSDLSTVVSRPIRWLGYRCETRSVTECEYPSR